MACCAFSTANANPTRGFSRGQSTILLLVFSTGEIRRRQIWVLDDVLVCLGENKSTRCHRAFSLLICRIQYLSHRCYGFRRYRSLLLLQHRSDCRVTHFRQVDGCSFHDCPRLMDKIILLPNPKRRCAFPNLARIVRQLSGVCAARHHIIIHAVNYFIFLFCERGST